MNTDLMLGLSYGYNVYGMSPPQGKGGVSLGSLGLGGILVSSGPGSSPHAVAQRESAIIAPADMISFGDGFGESRGKLYRMAFNEIGFNLSMVAYVSGTDPERLALLRHNSRANIAFCDGHVEGMRFDSLFGAGNDSYQRWNADHLPHRELRNP
jgi:prepilin-type processing-associated H-X9-DG protein